MPMSENIATEFGVRRWYTLEDETHVNESGNAADGPPLRKIVIAACLHNPYANSPFTPDLGDVVKRSPALGLEIGRRAMQALRGQAFESYGNAFLTATMMDPLRELLGGGLAWVPSTGKRGGPGCTIDIPLAHRDALYVRSHYDTATATFHDGPNPDEIIVAFAVATRGRLHARLGGLTVSEIKARDGLR